MINRILEAFSKTSLPEISFSGAYWPLWLVCISGVVLVVISILAMLLLLRKPEQRGVFKKNTNGMTMGERFDGTRNPITVRFYRIGTGNREVKTIILQNQTLAVGSSPTDDFCLSQEDPRLMPSHFNMRLSGSTLHITAGNGFPAVNGVPVRPPQSVPMQSGDSIWVGSMEYRVFFSANKERKDSR